MSICRPRSPLLFLVTIACAAASGCAGPEAAAPQKAAGVAAPAAAIVPGSLDGTYLGTRTPDDGTPDCGFANDIGYQVSGTTITLRTHKQNRALAGTIDAVGRFSLTNGNGSHQVVGVIQGGRLTATETTPPHRHRHSIGEPVPGGACTAQISASLVASPPADTDE